MKRLRRFTPPLLAVCLAFSLLLPRAVGDEILLNNGRSWKGTIVREDAREVVIVTAGGDISVPRGDIKAIRRGDAALRQYKRIKDKLDMTDAPAQYELGLWAQEHDLRRQAEFQFQLVLALEPHHEGAHKALGHVRHEGQWLTRDQYLVAQGYVRYQGRWVTPEQRDQIVVRKREEAEQQKWRATVLGLVRDLRGRSSRRRAEAETRLLSISDPAAFGQIVRLLAYSDESVRLAAIRAVARNNITDAVARVSSMALDDERNDVRTAAAAALRDMRSTDGLWALVKAMEGGNKRTRERAARALGVMQARDSIPALIDALFWKNPDAGKIVGNVPDPGPFVPRVQYFGPDGRPLDQQEPERAPDYLVNEEAWRSLVAITGKDFDYAKDQWRQWYAANKQALPEWPPRPDEKKPAPQ